MVDSEAPLRISAGESGRTYLGTHFCTGEAALRDAYQSLSADGQLAVNDARRAISEGADPEKELPGLKLIEPHRVLMSNCLATIADNRCPVYPRQA